MPSQTHDFNRPQSSPQRLYRVIELGHSVAAPYAGLVLAEMGAEVIKVERPGVGDDRGVGAAVGSGHAAVFRA